MNHDFGISFILFSSLSLSFGNSDLKIFKVTVYIFSSFLYLTSFVNHDFGISFIPFPSIANSAMKIFEVCIFSSLTSLNDEYFFI